MVYAIYLDKWLTCLFKFNQWLWRVAHYHSVYSQGLLTAVSDPLNRTNVFQRDALGCLAGIVPPAGPAVAFSNDSLGNVVTTQLPGQSGTPRLWQYLRNGFGNVTNAIAPDGIGVQGFYDAIGNLTGIVDRAGRQVFITYGVASRPLSITRTINDNGSNRTVTLATSRDLQMDPIAIVDPLGRNVESYVRDSAGRISTTTNVEGRTATVQYGPADLPLFRGTFRRHDEQHHVQRGLGSGILRAPRPHQHLFLAGERAAGLCGERTGHSHEFLDRARLADEPGDADFRLDGARGLRQRSIRCHHTGHGQRHRAFRRPAIRRRRAGDQPHPLLQRCATGEFPRLWLVERVADQRERRTDPADAWLGHP